MRGRSAVGFQIRGEDKLAERQICTKQRRDPARVTQAKPEQHRGSVGSARVARAKPKLCGGYVGSSWVMRG